MSTLAETFLNRKKVSATLNKFANILSRSLPASMDFEDARQELIVGLVERLPRYKPEMSNPETFAYYVVRTLASNMVNTKRLQRHEKTGSLLGGSFIDQIESRFDSRVVNNLTCDEIQKRLSGKAKQAFSYLRIGFSRSDCAEVMEVSRAYITALVKKRMKRVVNEYEYF